ncbi:PREDICTED: uncharacterized protein LOC106114750 [Papilio xuthus]|uniref:Uncharacterized protein LOC106114750 n=1 Tax=Papilio xuthus TaxID=66420 RepID=A0AAJ6Z220_PAPXU|nr:PREDICTED: uncharacterized protein LOC106114750 [Papilio xuthus]
MKNLNINKNKEKIPNKDISIDNNIVEFPNEYEKAAKQDGGYQSAVNSLTYFEQIQNKKEKFHVDNFEFAIKQVFENRTCDWFKSKQPYILIKKIIRKCNREHRRKGYGEDFLRTLTRTMNRFSKVSFEFTEDMVELVLERVFGKNVDLRDNIFDVDKLLRYLRNAMAHHDKHENRDSIIVLKPRHCLSVSVPGCFCRPGFVESSGQCVKPADCITESSNDIYLTRIIVH